MRLLGAVLFGVGLVILEMICIALAAAYAGLFGVAVSAVVLVGVMITLSSRRNRRRMS